MSSYREKHPNGTHHFQVRAGIGISRKVRVFFKNTVTDRQQWLLADDREAIALRAQFVAKG